MSHHSKKRKIGKYNNTIRKRGGVVTGGVVTGGVVTGGVVTGGVTTGGDILPASMSRFGKSMTNFKMPSLNIPDLGITKSISEGISKSLSSIPSLPNTLPNIKPYSFCDIFDNPNKHKLYKMYYSNSVISSLVSSSLGKTFIGTGILYCKGFIHDVSTNTDNNTDDNKPEAVTDESIVNSFLQNDVSDTDKCKYILEGLNKLKIYDSSNVLLSNILDSQNINKQMLVFQIIDIDHVYFQYHDNKKMLFKIDEQFYVILIDVLEEKCKTIDISTIKNEESVPSTTTSTDNSVPSSTTSTDNSVPSSTPSTDISVPLNTTSIDTSVPLNTTSTDISVPLNTTSGGAIDFSKLSPDFNHYFLKEASSTLISIRNRNPFYLFNSGNKVFTYLFRRIIDIDPYRQVFKNEHYIDFMSSAFIQNNGVSHCSQRYNVKCSVLNDREVFLPKDFEDMNILKLIFVFKYHYTKALQIGRFDFLRLIFIFIKQIILEKENNRDEFQTKMGSLFSVMNNKISKSVVTLLQLLSVCINDKIRGKVFKDVPLINNSLLKKMNIPVIPEVEQTVVETELIENENTTNSVESPPDEPIKGGGEDNDNNSDTSLENNDLSKHFDDVPLQQNNLQNSSLSDMFDEDEDEDYTLNPLHSNTHTEQIPTITPEQTPTTIQEQTPEQTPTTEQTTPTEQTTSTKNPLLPTSIGSPSQEFDEKCYRKIEEFANYKGFARFRNFSITNNYIISLLNKYINRLECNGLFEEDVQQFIVKGFIEFICETIKLNKDSEIIKTKITNKLIEKFGQNCKINNTVIQLDQDESIKKIVEKISQRKNCISQFTSNESVDIEPNTEDSDESVVETAAIPTNNIIQSVFKEYQQTDEKELVEQIIKLIKTSIHPDLFFVKTEEYNDSKKPLSLYMVKELFSIIEELYSDNFKETNKYETLTVKKTKQILDNTFNLEYAIFIEKIINNTYQTNGKDKMIEFMTRISTSMILGMHMSCSTVLSAAALMIHLLEPALVGPLMSNLIDPQCLNAGAICVRTLFQEWFDINWIKEKKEEIAEKNPEVKKELNTAIEKIENNIKNGEPVPVDESKSEEPAIEEPAIEEPAINETKSDAHTNDEPKMDASTIIEPTSGKTESDESTISNGQNEIVNIKTIDVNSDNTINENAVTDTSMTDNSLADTTIQKMDTGIVPIVVNPQTGFGFLSYDNDMNINKIYHIQNNKMIEIDNLEDKNNIINKFINYDNSAEIFNKEKLIENLK